MVVTEPAPPTNVIFNLPPAIFRFASNAPPLICTSCPPVVIVLAGLPQFPPLIKTREGIVSGVPLRVTSEVRFIVSPPGGTLRRAVRSADPVAIAKAEPGVVAVTSLE
jgi:hypothetical protein